MIAVVQIGGHQAIVHEGEKLEVDKIDLEPGKMVELPTLLLSEEDGTSFQMGEPYLEGVLVQAKVLEHGKGDKIRVYKMKPRKRYRRTIGHRQDYTLIEIISLGGKKTKKVSEEKELLKGTSVEKEDEKETKK